MVIERDVLEIRKVRQRDVLPEILRRLAAQSAQLLNPAAVARTIELDKSTVNDFIRLLESVFLVHRLEAYGRTLSARANHSPKAHLVDSGLAAYLLGITERRLESGAGHADRARTRRRNLCRQRGIEAGWLGETPPIFSHFRTKDGYEVDLVCETQDGRVAGNRSEGRGPCRRQGLPWAAHVARQARQGVHRGRGALPGFPLLHP